MAQFYAFVDPSTNILKTVGTVLTNQDGDIRVEVQEDFSYKPGFAKYENGQWAEYTPEPQVCLSCAGILAQALISKGLVTQEEIDALAVANGVTFYE